MNHRNQKRATRPRSLGDLGIGVTSPPCSNGLTALKYAMDQCEHYSVAEIKEFVTGFAMYLGHEWIKEKRFSRYRDWMAKMADSLESLEIQQERKTKTP